MLIYNEKFSIEEEITHAIVWISFSDLKPTCFVKDSIFLLAAAIGRPLHLDSVTINKT